MSQSEWILCIIKLVLGGIGALLAILFWSKTRDSAWMALVGGIVISYAGVIYDILLRIKVISTDSILLFGLPLTSLLFTVIPDILIIIALAVMLYRSS